MNEKAKFEPTLPEVEKYTDITPTNEDDLYPLETAQADNTKSYKQELKNTDSFSLLKKLRTRFQPDESGNDKSEFDARVDSDEAKKKLELGMDEKKGELQEEGKNSIIRWIEEDTSISELRTDLKNAEGSLSSGSLNNEGISEIKAAYDKRLGELQEEESAQAGT